eukprot:4642878-Amphidinium_carterae.1
MYRCLNFCLIGASGLAEERGRVPHKPSIAVENSASDVAAPRGGKMDRIRPNAEKLAPRRIVPLLQKPIQSQHKSLRLMYSKESLTQRKCNRFVQKKT